MTDSLINAKSQPLAFMLREGTFSIPWHQRLYTWDKEHVEILLDDLTEAIRENTALSFFRYYHVDRKR